MIGPTTGFKAKAGNLILLDTRQQGDPTGTKAGPGFHYRFPEIERVGFARGIIFHAYGHDFGPTIDGRDVMSIGSLPNWMVTLRQPDGEYICRDFPVIHLLGGSRNIRLRRMHYFADGLIIDPRQSYLSTGSINSPRDVIPFTLLF